MVLFYKTNKYEGKLSSSNEGEVYWMEIDDMKKANLADGMEKVLEVFLKENLRKFAKINDFVTFINPIFLYLLTFL